MRVLRVKDWNEADVLIDMQLLLYSWNQIPFYFSETELERNTEEHGAEVKRIGLILYPDLLFSFTWLMMYLRGILNSH